MACSVQLNLGDGKPDASGGAYSGTSSLGNYTSYQLVNGHYVPVGHVSSNPIDFAAATQSGEALGSGSAGYVQETQVAAAPGPSLAIAAPGAAPSASPEAYSPTYQGAVQPEGAPVMLAKTQGVGSMAPAPSQSLSRGSDDSGRVESYSIGRKLLRGQL